jgi:NAD(P)-dependent dehydrogenase (short-subunit alcohol dehydrogenase family)
VLTDGRGSANVNVGSVDFSRDRVCPGVRRLEAWADRPDDQTRAGSPEEIGRSIVFLCSDDASYITGTTLTPDGGFTPTF